MKKIISSPIMLWAEILFGYIAATSSVRGLSRSFDYYMRVYVGDWLKMPLMDALMLFIICVALMLSSVWFTDRGKKIPVLRGIDGALLTALTYGAVLSCIHFTRYGLLEEYLSGGYPFQILFFPAIAYLAIMLLLAEVAARIRDRQLIQTLYWLRFFRLHSVWRPTGFLMAVFLAVDALLLFIYSPLEMANTGRVNIPFLIFLLFTMYSLICFCKFALSLNTENAKANEEKIRAERFKSELITNVSHDIRTPLTAIISYVDLLKALPIDHAQFAEYMDVLDKKTARLKTLIDDLLEASKAGTGNIAMDIHEIDLAEIVGQIAGEFDDLFGERSLTLVSRQPDTPVLVLADSRSLWRILENLFGNAAKYAMPGTRVFAEIAAREGEPVFTIKNTSQNPVDLAGDMLTEQFIRGDRARQTEGSGLGQ
ncbi:MAG: HAMP domain-containing histidine kinase [Peptococcaceae bacterium]|jgi:signal transduction histidine kinase|nr:HAMP domain-containing histidine kinase [Peptococcaceae bacterium]